MSIDSVLRSNTSQFDHRLPSSVAHRWGVITDEGVSLRDEEERREREEIDLVVFGSGFEEGIAGGMACESGEKRETVPVRCLAQKRSL